MESPVVGVESLPEVQNSVSGVDHDPPSTSGTPRPSWPPPRTSRNHRDSSTSHLTGHHNHGNTIHHQDSDVVVQKLSYKEDSGAEHEGLPNMAKHYYIPKGKSDYVGLNNSVESCLGKNISTMETKLCIKPPFEDPKNCYSSSIMESARMLGASKKVDDQTKSCDQSEITLCQSPRNSLYTEAKQSFTNTGVSECVSVDKSVESGEVADSSEFNESRKTSIHRGSTGSDVSDESSTSNLSSALYKPHKANDIRWVAIQAIRARDGTLEMRHFRLLKKLGCGDIGSVYLAELSGTRTCFAMKVMNKTELASCKKLLRA